MTTPSIDPKVLGELIAIGEQCKHQVLIGLTTDMMSDSQRKIYYALDTLLALQAALSAPVAEGWWCEHRSTHFYHQYPDKCYGECKHEPCTNKPQCKPVIIIATEGK